MIEKEFNELIGIKENYQLPDALMSILMDKEKREFVFDQFSLKYGISDSDVLRDYYQKRNADRETLKQDYTPDCLCELMSRLFQKTTAITDLCSGTGALSLAAFKNKKAERFQLFEVSDAVLPILLFNLSIRNMNADVIQQDILTKNIKTIYRLDSGEDYSDIKICHDHEFQKTDVLISNPPYSLSWNPHRDERFNEYELAPKSRADYAFVLDAISKLTDKGKAFIILPHGVLFRGQAEESIRKELINRNLIDAVIGLPNNMFMNTGIPVCIMVISKCKQDKSILFVDASKQAEKIGKFNVMQEDDIKKISNTYLERKEMEKFSHVASIDEVKNNDFNLNIPRYVDRFEQEELLPLHQSFTELIEIENHIQDVSYELLEFMENMTGFSEEERNDIERLYGKYKDGKHI